jgi:signal transduction histidine kinase
MALELSAVAAGLPMAASFAMAGGFVAHREGRRRSALNAAMHELRRPLQALSLVLSSGPAAVGPLEGSLEMAVAAVERLDREINGCSVLSASRRFSARSVVEPAVDRWRPVADDAGRFLRLSWSGCDRELDGDPIALAQAVDNLISNALVHGRGAIALEVEADHRLLQLAVKDGGVCEAGALGGTRSPRWDRISGRDRHGHGLGVVREAAAQFDGEFRLDLSPSGSEAILVLPLCGGAR